MNFVRYILILTSIVILDALSHRIKCPSAYIDSSSVDMLLSALKLNDQISRCSKYGLKFECILSISICVVVGC